MKQMLNMTRVFCLAVLCQAISAPATAPKKEADLWVLKPVARPQIPAGATKSANPIDAFIAAEYKSKGLGPVDPADKLTLLRRVHLDLVGIPPTPAEQDAFLHGLVSGRV
jgi:hypothetical protein